MHKNFRCCLHCQCKLSNGAFPLRLLLPEYIWICFFKLPFNIYFNIFIFFALFYFYPTATIQYLTKKFTTQLVGGREGCEEGRLAWYCMQMRHIALIIPVLSSRWAAQTSHWDRIGSSPCPFLVNIACAMKISTSIFTATKNLRPKKCQPIEVIMGGEGRVKGGRGQAEQTFMKIFALRVMRENSFPSLQLWLTLGLGK